jgi:hypothetical protein
MILPCTIHGVILDSFVQYSNELKSLQTDRRAQVGRPGGLDLWHCQHRLLWPVSPASRRQKWYRILRLRQAGPFCYDYSEKLTAY